MNSKVIPLLSPSPHLNIVDRCIGNARVQLVNSCENIGTHDNPEVAKDIERNNHNRILTVPY